MPFNLDQISKKHPDLVKWLGRLNDYQLLYVGGADMLAAAGTFGSNRVSDTGAAGSLAVISSTFNRPVRRFLHQLEGEPNPVYFARWNRAYYIGYLPAIIDYFCQWLFSAPPNIGAVDAGETQNELPDWYQPFYDDCDGAGTSFMDFARDAFLNVCIFRRSGWLIGCNTEEPEGDAKAILTPYTQFEIYDWQRDSYGQLEWVVLHKETTRRDFPGERRAYETYTYVDREKWESYEVVKGDTKDTDKLKMLGGADHGCGKVPFVMMEIPEGLWIADKLASVQVQLFNQMNMLSNAELMGCIMQPYILTDDDRETAQSRIFGENILLHLKTGNKSMGTDSEDFGWKTPDTKPLEFIAQAVKDLRDEMYRIVHQMALAVDAKSVGAIARSGASKIEDRKAAEIILTGYGGYVIEAIKKTLELMGEIYGDKTEFSVDGFDNFQISTLDEEIQIAALASTLNIPSPTFDKKIAIKMAYRLLDKEDEKTKETIAEEIRDAIDLKQEQAMAPPSIPHVVGPDGQQTQVVGAPIGGAPPNGIVPPKTLGFPDKGD
jgi:hypothetical protein